MNEKEIIKDLFNCFYKWQTKDSANKSVKVAVDFMEKARHKDRLLIFELFEQLKCMSIPFVSHWEIEQKAKEVVVDRYPPPWLGKSVKKSEVIAMVDGAIVSAYHRLNLEFESKKAETIKYYEELLKKQGVEKKR